MSVVHENVEIKSDPEETYATLNNELSYSEYTDKNPENTKKEFDRRIESDRDKRLEFLLKQREIFSHFVANEVKQELSNHVQKRKKSQKQTLLNSAYSKHRRHLRNENEEEEFLTGSDAVQDVVTQFDSTPFYIKNGLMRDYQIRGLNWLISLYENGINGILADEMGLGKTLQTVSLLGYLKHYRNMNGPHLIIAPKSTLQPWINEFSKWCPSLDIICLIGSNTERKELINNIFLPRNWEVCIISYEVALCESSLLKKLNWQYLVIDEAHRIKNEKSKLSELVRIFKTTNRLLLTGTPLQNNLHELWAMLNFLLPDVFNSAEDFDNWFNTKSCLNISVIERLHAILRPFLLRRIKTDVEKTLLPKKEVKIYVGLSQMQREWYRSILMRDISVINSFASAESIQLLNILMQLRKCTNHPYLFKGAEPGPPYTNGEHLVHNCGKMVLLDKLLLRLKEQGSRVLLFCQMTRMLDIIEDYFFLRNFSYCRLDGETSFEDRQIQIDGFNAPNSEKFIFVLSTRAGGLGISLSSADVVIIYDSDWNPQVDLQAMDRAHRIGQMKQVKVFRLITENTIEEKIVERADVKLRLDKLVIQHGRLVDGKKPLKKEDLFNTVRFGAAEVLASTNSEITDEDIDTILLKGEIKTEEINQKLENLGESSLRDFTLEMPRVQMFTFEGENYREKQLIVPGDSWIELPKRERKSSYVNCYGNTMVHTPLVPKYPGTPEIYDFQFFPSRLPKLLQKEYLYYLKTIDYKVKTKDNREPEQSKIDAAEPLTKEEMEEKAELFTKGFMTWDCKDYKQFIGAVKKFGSENQEAVCRSVKSKTATEVGEYEIVFWERCKELKHIEHVLEKVRNDAQIRVMRMVRSQRRVSMEEALNAKMKQYSDPFKELKIEYSEAKKAGTSTRYTKELDRFLICTLYKLGFKRPSVYIELKKKLDRSPEFVFDSHARSKSVHQLMNRCNVLLDLILKEQEMQEQAKNQGEQRLRVSGDVVSVNRDAYEQQLQLFGMVKPENRDLPEEPLFVDVKSENRDPYEELLPLHVQPEDRDFKENNEIIRDKQMPEEWVEIKIEKEWSFGENEDVDKEIKPEFRDQNEEENSWKNSSFNEYNSERDEVEEEKQMSPSRRESNQNANGNEQTCNESELFETTTLEERKTQICEPRIKDNVEENLSNGECEMLEGTKHEDSSILGKRNSEYQKLDNGQKLKTEHCPNFRIKLTKINVSKCDHEAI